MTLYEFKLLDEVEQFNTIWGSGIFLGTVVENGHKINLYAIDMFFVEVVYDGINNKIVENRAFLEGHRLDKYSKPLKSYFDDEGQAI